MKIPSACKVEAIASTDETRPFIGHPFLTGSKLVATNGQALVVIPIELSEGDADGYVTAAALKLARKGSDNPEIRCNGTLTLSDGTQLPRPGAQGKPFPDYRQCVPKDPPTLAIAFSVKNLRALGDALGAQHLVLEIKDATSPVIVRPAGYRVPVQEAFGVLVPYRIK